MPGQLASATKNDGGWALSSGMQEVIQLPSESQDWWEQNGRRRMPTGGNCLQISS
ncbi:hypothetical protein PGT21_031127 [Puccinia graminis f. sp. tritici]|uniref:Uncharacterized protein n=1 Tax=Puccinia graminis f. sp. tritici TaxID=56615 RepID=A0A5B0Q819_PUCGR|nr:hypothetical protein PGT21_031127 [Puccinia graminis f. sp. tritici]KAA1109265.1 hypothetical protein PGTUg99_024426 [Puccinia graminis f. sp. tritici]